MVEHERIKMEWNAKTKSFDDVKPRECPKCGKIGLEIAGIGMGGMSEEILCPVHGKVVFVKVEVRANKNLK